MLVCCQNIISDNIPGTKSSHDLSYNMTYAKSTDKMSPMRLYVDVAVCRRGVNCAFSTFVLPLCTKQSVLYKLLLLLLQVEPE